MEKTRKSVATDVNMFYHIKVLYGIVLLLLVILMGEIWTYYRRLYQLQSQINSIALTQNILINEKTRYFNVSQLHTLQLIDLDQFTNELLHVRFKRNMENIRDSYRSTDSVSAAYIYICVCVMVACCLLSLSRYCCYVFCFYYNNVENTYEDQP